MAWNITVEHAKVSAQMVPDFGVSAQKVWAEIKPYGPMTYEHLFVSAHLSTAL